VAKPLCQLVADFRAFSLTSVIDNACYRPCDFMMDLATAVGIELLFLPPNSPNGNLIERFWKVRQKE
jgi:transposase